MQPGPGVTHKMLDVIESLTIELETFLEPCEHDINICWCSTRGYVQNGYRFLHENGRGNHDRDSKDYEMTDDGGMRLIDCCSKCGKLMSDA